MSRTKEDRAIYMRLWRKRHPELVLEQNRKYRAKHRDVIRAGHRRARLRGKVPSGRVCRSCDRTDHETCWSIAPSLCAACRKRGDTNGFCDGCGFAIYLTSGRGARPVRRCRCPDAFELSMWDALRWHDESSISFRSLAERMGVNLRTVERKREEILSVLRRFDPEARIGRDVESGGAMAFWFSPRLVAAGLERLALGVAS